MTGALRPQTRPQQDKKIPMQQNLLHTIKLQQLASNPNNSAWVFASAGSGKTKILTDRVLRLLLDDVAPGKILCLTFTKVAAAEMQERINSELMKWVLCNEEELVKKLSDLSGNFVEKNQLKKARVLFTKILDGDSRIKIQTIHAFCQTLIKIFPFEAKIKPNFEVMEERQEKLLLEQARKLILTKALRDDSLKNLVMKINAKLHEANFAELISELLDKKENLLSLKENFFGIDGVIAEIFKSFALSQNKTAEEICSDFLAKTNRQEILYLALELENTGAVQNKKISASIKVLLENPTVENFSSYQHSFFTEKNEPRKLGKKLEENAELLKLATNQQKLITEFNDKLNSHKICHNSALLLKFVDEILQIYTDLKKQNAVLDYNDLISETNALLSNPDFSEWIKMKMDGSFDHILIDESQDTNHQQWNIIKALSDDFFSGLSASNKNRSIFIVGDEKQSIYNFQGADANISSEIFSYFEQKLGNKLLKIELNNSFRSLPIILQAVDKVFSESQRKSAISKVSEFQEHKPIRDGFGKVEIWPQIIPAKVEKEKSYEWKIDFAAEKNNENPAEILAEIIASKIKHWIENKRPLESANRPLKYGDFMILLRNRTNGLSDALIKNFHKFNIPFSSNNRIKFSDNLLIQDLLAAARFVLLPEDDLNLACLLKSPILGISEEDLFEICLVKNKEKINIYKALGQLPKFQEVRENLEEFIVKSQQLNCFEFFYFLLNQQNSQQRIIDYFGDDSLEMLDQFTSTIFDFCQNFSSSLQKLLEFIEKVDAEIAITNEKNDRVKITTIHSAKGLQAPVVIIPDCCYYFSKLLSSREEISWINFSGDDLFPIWCSKKTEENFLLKAHRKEKFIEAKEEYLRLLYVAMTRAEDELYIGGFGASNDPESWYEIVKNSLKDFADFVAIDGFKIEEIKELKNDLETPSPLTKQDSLNLRAALAPFSKKASGEINQGQIKGKLIHKVLEVIGKNYAEEKSWLLNLAQKIIAREEFLNAKEKKEITYEISAFIDSNLFTEIFSNEVKCEVEIVGKINDRDFLGRIDLLIVKENEVLIVDYKSDEAMSEGVSQQYQNQLRNYQNLVQKIYPRKKVSCAVLWVKGLRLEIF